MARKHRVEVDQSGRFSQGGPVVLAFSNDISASVKVKQCVKNDLYRDVIYLSKSRIIGELKAFSAILYLLLAPFLEQIERVVIDTEYPGHEADIRGMLLNHIRAGEVRLDKQAIEFARVGKSSPAHKLALSVRRCRSRETVLLRTRDVKRVL